MDNAYERPAEQSGFRLARLEVYNWGTFDSGEGQVHCVEPAGRTSLLVGQNGSGKSTLIDALLTLLVPSAIRNYNVAAGAKKTERSERSYLRGAFGRGGDPSASNAVKYLRPGLEHYSALMAVFTDPSLQESFTICQVIYQNGDGSLDKTYALASQARRLANDLAGITTADSVRDQLRQQGYRTTKKYVEYESWITRRTGMRAKAMDMFNQTVAVKDIHSLNDFVRRHMLEASDWREKVQRLLTHFNELAGAHRELGRVKLAEELLLPIRNEGLEYQKLAAQLNERQRLLDVADLFFHQQTIKLYEPELLASRAELDRVQSEKQWLSEELDRLSDELRSLQNELDQEKGERARLVPLLIERERALLDGKQREFERFHQAVRAGGIDQLANTAENFEQLRDKMVEVRQQATERLAEVNQQRETLVAERLQLTKQLKQEQLRAEAFQARAQQLPHNLHEVRDRLCSNTGIPVEDLPFAAELISIRSDQQAWQPAIEMVLRRFALSLLVPERHYQRLSRAIDAGTLVDDRGVGQKLVYLRVTDTATAAENRDGANRQKRIVGTSPGPQERVIDKLEITPGHEMSDWIKRQIARRFDYLCCQSIEQFTRHSGMALTVQRHLKSGNQHHEKDDRPSASDARNFVLGGDPLDHRQRYDNEIQQLTQQLERLQLEIARVDGVIESLRDKIEAVKTALSVTVFETINVNRHLREINALEAELAAYSTPTQRKKLLGDRLEQLHVQLAETQQQRDKQVMREAELNQSLQACERVLQAAHENLSPTGEATESQHALLEMAQLFAERPLSVENLFSEQQQFEKQSHQEVVRLRERMEPLAERLIGAMSRYLREFPDQQSDLDARTEALSSFLGRLEEIQREDLPRHQQRFKNRLNEKISQELALFHGALRTEAKQIETKLSQLNASLAELEYNPDTFMRLEMRPVVDREITEFQKQIRHCLEASPQDSDEQREKRYHRIEELISRLADSQRTRWREKVIDVRRWYDFVACEVQRSNEEVIGCYEDSSGQSGGEKAKLAFTILVAAIAYQYDLNPHLQESGKFRFVCVDEMFSKVDDRYAEYALRLFEQFGLQLLIVAPLDAKARVTEPFVDCYLHVVKDAGTSKSRIFSMSAHEYTTVASGFGEPHDLPAGKKRPK